MNSTRRKRVLIGFMVIGLYVASFCLALIAGVIRIASTTTGTQLYSTHRAAHECGNWFYFPIHSAWPGVRWAKWGELVHFGV